MDVFLAVVGCGGEGTSFAGVGSGWRGASRGGTPLQPLARSGAGRQGIDVVHVHLEVHAADEVDVLRFLLPVRLDRIPRRVDAEGVAAILTPEDVLLPVEAAVETIVSGPAVEVIQAAVAGEGVVPAVPVDPVGTVAAGQDVVAAAAGEDI